jgi:pyrophosphatase PpaX
MRLRGMIFDLDGTLADTVPLGCAALREALAPVTGRSWSAAEIVALFGPSEVGIIRRLAGDDWEASHQAFLLAYAREHERCTAPCHGIIDVIDLPKRVEDYRTWVEHHVAG